MDVTELVTQWVANLFDAKLYFFVSIKAMTHFGNKLETFNKLKTQAKHMAVCIILLSFFGLTQSD